MSVSALDIVSNVGAIDDLTSTARLIMNLPVALLDAIFILWVFASLSATLRTLQFRNATGKLQLYRRFTNALAAWVWVSVAWVAYEMYLKVNEVMSILCIAYFCCAKFLTVIAFAWHMLTAQCETTDLSISLMFCLGGFVLPHTLWICNST